jgi:hypothetical protein
VGGPLAQPGPAGHLAMDCSVTPKWPLTATVHATAIDADLVLLDAALDAYFCLPGAADALCDDGRSLVLTDRQLVAQVLAAGLIQAEPAASARPPPVELPRPARTAVRLTYPPPRIQDMPDAASALFDVGLHYRGRPFPEILQSAVHRRPRVPASPSAELLDFVDAFHRWIPYLPVSGKCLLRAYMLLRFLGRKGHAAHWVFGVSTWPFRAHCWLQCGETVLDDDHERVADFTPILVL